MTAHLEEKEKMSSRGSDRRKGDRRQRHVDPADLPFPDRRKGGDRRQVDRRVISEEEKDEILKRVNPPDSDVETSTNPEKLTEE